MAQNIFISFLQALHVKYTITFASKLFMEHPYRYTLLGLSDLLYAYHIPNVGVRVRDKDIYRLNPPFIAHVANDFAIVSKVTENKVYYTWNKRNLYSTPEEFKKQWDGTVLIAEPNNDSIEPDFPQNRHQELTSRIFQCAIYGILIAYMIILGWSNHIEQSLNRCLLLLVSVSGAQISYLLLQKQMKNDNKYADRLCTLFHQKDCNDILETDAAKIGPFSWSEIGFGYFVSNIILLVSFPGTINYLAWVNICTLPYTFWSIWYQAYKAKQWCMLCVIVQVLLWVLFILNIVSHNILFPEITFIQIGTVLFVYIFAILVVNLWTMYIASIKETVGIRQDLVSLRGNNNVFTALLKQADYYPVEVGTSQIIFGNPEASLKITILTNPHCEPCGRMHKRVEALLQKKGNDLCVQYIFSAFNEDLLKSNRFLIAAYLQSYPQSREQIYSQWYRKGKYNAEKYFNQFEFNINEEVETELQKHEQWKQRSGLKATPTILINGYRLPKQYNIEDLQYQTDITI